MTLYSQYIFLSSHRGREDFLLQCPTMAERVEILNKAGDSSGVTTKDEAHERGLLHPVVVVYLWDPQGRLYVQRRTKDNHLDHSVAGHISFGETPEQAAQRELAEEFGIPSPLKLQWIGEATDTPRKLLGEFIHHHYLVYEAKLAKPPPLNPSVFTELRTYTIKQLQKEMSENPKEFSNGFKVSLDLYLQISRKKDKPYF